MIWTDELLGLVLSLRKDQLSYSQIGKRLNLSRGQVAGALNRYQIEGRIFRSDGIGGRRKADDSNYIETWADRKVRLAQERDA